ncbi:MAG: hypothetical protein FWG43_01080 [Clostridiales bacterium]|nr:hypothetical protein [Clostridiales bacterium]
MSICQPKFLPLIRGKTPQNPGFPFSEKKHNRNKSFIYAGGGELDWELIKKILIKYPDYCFNIIGNFNKKLPYDNVVVYGYLDYSQYQDLFLNSDISIIPYSDRFAFQCRKCFFAAKILFSMSLGMPILLKSYGVIQNSDPEKKLFVYKTHKEALAMLDKIIQKIESGTLNRDVSQETNNFLFPHLAENRLKELEQTFSKWIG